MKLMQLAKSRAGLIAACTALTAAAACNKTNSSQPMTDDLKQDLVAATSVQPQVVVSAEEAGETSAPVHAAPRRIPRPTTKPAPHLASDRNPAPAPAPTPARIVTQAPAPQPQQPAAASDPAPPVAPAAQAPHPAERQRGVYKSEGEIFRQMPWIRP